MFWQEGVTQEVFDEVPKQLSFEEVNRVSDHARVPKRFWNASADFVSDAAVIKSALNFIQRYNPSTGIVFSGGLGVGKSSLAAMTYRTMVAARRLSGVWVNALDWARIKMDRPIYNNVDWYLAGRDWPLVVIDDVVESQKDFVTNELEILLRSRLDSELLTIVTTNMDVANGKTVLCSLLRGFRNLVEVKGADFR